EETGHASIHAAPWPGARELDPIPPPAEPASFEAAVGCLAAINKRKSEAGVSVGRAVVRLALAASPTTLTCLGPVAADVMAAARVAEYALRPRRVGVPREAAEETRAERGRVLATLEGDARALLAGERVALNLLQHLCGIATLTRAYVERVRGTPLVVRDTRKTLPGLRALAKYAVRTGGGTNHRLGLDDAILIKDNHLALGGGEAAAAVRRARRA